MLNGPHFAMLVEMGCGYRASSCLFGGEQFLANFNLFNSIMLAFVCRLEDER
jgi:hypothetical protein